MIRAFCGGWLRPCGSPTMLGLSLNQAVAVYVARDAVDLRKSIDGLALWVETSLPVSPVSGSVFVFFNRQRDKVKLLWWDRHGFWLAYKRLEKGRFRKPVNGAISRSELLLLLEGVDLSVARFREVRARRIG